MRIRIRRHPHQRAQYRILTSKKRLPRIGSRFPLSEAILRIWRFGLRLWWIRVSDMIYPSHWVPNYLNWSHWVPNLVFVPNAHETSSIAILYSSHSLAYLICVTSFACVSWISSFLSPTLTTYQIPLSYALEISSVFYWYSLRFIRLTSLAYPPLVDPTGTFE